MYKSPGVLFKWHMGWRVSIATYLLGLGPEAIWLVYLFIHMWYWCLAKVCPSPEEQRPRLQTLQAGHLISTEQVNDAIRNPKEIKLAGLHTQVAWTNTDKLCQEFPQIWTRVITSKWWFNGQTVSFCWSHRWCSNEEYYKDSSLLVSLHWVLQVLDATCWKTWSRNRCPQDVACWTALVGGPFSAVTLRCLKKLQSTFFVVVLWGSWSLKNMVKED